MRFWWIILTNLYFYLWSFLQPCPSILRKKNISNVKIQRTLQDLNYPFCENDFTELTNFVRLLVLPLLFNILAISISTSGLHWRINKSDGTCIFLCTLFLYVIRAKKWVIDVFYYIISSSVLTLCKYSEKTFRNILYIRIQNLGEGFTPYYLSSFFLPYTH